MVHQSLYRKYRPKRFADVTGQDPIVRAIGNQVITGTLANAYLFTGTRGTGKTTVAKIFARAVNCENVQPDGSPCGECPTCKGIADGSLMNVIEIDAASNNGVDNVRTIIEEVAYSPQSGKKKVYIIDEAHMLSPAAANALLKTIEEPPDYMMFILATTEAGSLPITILSRCQRYDFRRMTADVLAARMKKVLAEENREAEDKAISFIARQADGSMRDALSLLDQCIAFNLGETLTYDRTLDILGAVDTTVYDSLMKAVTEGRLKDAVMVLDDAVMKGREVQAFVIDFISYMRNLLLISANGSTGADIADILGVSSDTYERMGQIAGKTDADTLMRYIRIFSELSSEIKYSSQKKILTEIAIVRMMHPEMQEDAASLRQRMAILERKLDRMEREGVKTAGAAGAQSPQQVTVKKVPLPEALPADVKMVCDNWGRIIHDAKDIVRGILSEAKPSVDKDKLVIVCKDEISAGSLKENAKELEEILERETKKEIRFDIYGPAKGDDPETRYPDLESMINFTINITNE
ncbi:MAG: DNA polymerase III subunit gamma/tau [Lachnospiraceae bacterium]|nr:DNA polymerase III subunit gamma/tau [Lachnospiraceae bacterium]